MEIREDILFSAAPTFFIDHGIPYQNGIPYPDFQRNSFRHYTDLSSGWKRKRQSLNHLLSLSARDGAGVSRIVAEACGRERKDYDDSDWIETDIPHAENRMCSYESGEGPEVYENGVWYRKKFPFPARLGHESYTLLVFEGANYMADVWLNGMYIGYHEGGYTPFAFDITETLTYGGENILCVRIDNPPRGSGIASTFSIVPYLQCDWFNYTGLTRPVYCVSMHAIHIERADIKTLDTEGNAEMTVILNNSCDRKADLLIELNVFEADGSNTDMKETVLGDEHCAGHALISVVIPVRCDAHTVKIVRRRFMLSRGKYWHPDSPCLYIARLDCTEDEKLIDTYYTRFGLRTLAVEDAHIVVNGEKAPYLAGAGRHEDSPTGPAMGTDALFNDLQIIRNKLNATVIRGHYPFEPVTYLFTDRLGLVVFAEIPVCWFDGNHMTAQLERGIAQQMWREMIFGAYNAPSLWFLSCCNESGSREERMRFIRTLHDDADTIDGTRFVVQAASGSDAGDKTYEACDIVCPTMYYGVFFNDRGEGNYERPTRKALESLHGAFPDKPILVAEFGTWSGPSDDRLGEQVKCFRDSMDAFLSYSGQFSPGDGDYVAGSIWWTAFDWYTPLTGLQTMGVYHMDRIHIKPVGKVMGEVYGEIHRHNIFYIKE